MPDATQLYCDAFGDYWAMSASVTFAGATSGMAVPGVLLEQKLIEIGVTSKDLIVDGISVRYTKAGGGAVVSPIVYTGPEAGHFLNPFTTAVINGPQSYAPLGMLVRLSTHNVFMIGATTANLESVMMSAWGRVAPVRFAGEIKEPEDVVVKRIEVWPFNREK